MKKKLIIAFILTLVTVLLLLGFYRIIISDQYPIVFPSKELKNQDYYFLYGDTYDFQWDSDELIDEFHLYLLMNTSKHPDLDDKQLVEMICSQDDFITRVMERLHHEPDDDEYYDLLSYAPGKSISVYFRIPTRECPYGWTPSRKRIVYKSYDNRVFIGDGIVCEVCIPYYASDVNECTFKWYDDTCD